MALTAYLRRASVGGAATAFDDDVGLLVKHGRSEDEGGSGATRSRGRSRRKAGQASAQRMIEEIGVCTRQGSGNNRPDHIKPDLQLKKKLQKLGAVQNLVKGSQSNTVMFAMHDTSESL